MDIPRVLEENEQVPEIKQDQIGPEHLGKLIQILTEKEVLHGRLIGKNFDPRVLKVVASLLPTIRIDLVREESRKRTLPVD